MRVLICGDRNWANRECIRSYLQTLPRDTEILVGGAPGADKIAEELAREMNASGEKYFNIRVFPANWAYFGRAAGPIRNGRMLDEKPDFLVAFHNDLPNSKGTKNCVEQAFKRGRIIVRVIKDAE